MRTIILILLISLSAVSCGPKKATTSNTVIKDSTWVETTVTSRDTLIPVAGDSLKIIVRLAELRDKLYIKKSVSGRVTGSASLADDLLTIDCKVDSLLLAIELKDKTINTLKSRLEKKTETIFVPEKYIPLPVKILSWIGGLGLLFFGAKTLIKRYTPL